MKFVIYIKQFYIKFIFISLSPVLPSKVLSRMSVSVMQKHNSYHVLSVPSLSLFVVDIYITMMCICKMLDEICYIHKPIHIHIIMISLSR